MRESIIKLLKSTNREDNKLGLSICTLEELKEIEFNFKGKLDVPPKSRDFYINVGGVVWVYSEGYAASTTWKSTTVANERFPNIEIIENPNL